MTRHAAFGAGTNENDLRGRGEACRRECEQGAHACTKFGSKAWEFATPLLLLQFSNDGSLTAPTVFGLTVFVLKFLFGPAAGRWMDRTPRMRVVRIGIALQALGVVPVVQRRPVPRDWGRSYRYFPVVCRFGGGLPR